MNTRPNFCNEIEILVVEDSATQARQLAQLLELEGGYRVRIAADGRVGLAEARRQAPTLIVTDIAMPQMDGFEMCKAIKQDEALRDIPVILLTSLSSVYHVIKGLDCGADNFIRKPFDAGYLLGRIRFILANRALRSNERVQLGMQLCLSIDADQLADDRHVLETVGSQIAVAVERAHLYGHMESLLDERTAALESERALLEAVVNTSGALVCVCDGDGAIRLFNPACEQSSGWRAEEVLGRPFRELFHRADGTPALTTASPAGAVPAQQRGEWVARDGSVRSMIWTSTLLRRADGTVQYVVTTGMDVTELHRAEERLRYLSNFDPETGLPNEVLLRDRVRQMRARVVDGRQLLGYMLVRVTRLEVIKASLGLDAGQALLRQAAARLDELGHGDVTVARTGERTFAIAALRANEAELGSLARQVLERMDGAFVHEDQLLHLDPCIGIALFPNDGDDYDTIAQGAEAALQRVPASRDERYAFYRRELNAGMYERFRVETALRRALERDELTVVYQPQASLATGKIVGFEALLRWQHPEHGLIPPNRFITLAEETGLILPIGDMVLRRACEQLCAWQREGLRAVPVSVNLSARQFSERIVDTVGGILAETGLEPRLLELELTESASMEDPKRTFDILRKLKDMGVRLAIDDFGTGYSNLNYLKRFPVDRLKLDQSFVRELTSDPDDLAIARAVIAMAHGLRLDVIAEGVETDGQLALLAQYGCNEIQGCLFGHPGPPAECAHLLREERSLALDKLLPQPYQRTLLYVDDEVNLLSAVRRAMRHSGFRVLVATRADEAFETLATTEVGVIVCDQRMRGMSGAEFLARVKQMYPHAVRIVLSGYTDLQSVTDAVNHGAIFKFLTKPWIDEELTGAVRDAFVEFEVKRGMLAGAG